MMRMLRYAAAALAVLLCRWLRRSGSRLLGRLA